MKTIAISGIIANYEMESESNVTPATLRKSLDDAGGDDLLITINSPGGSVFAGLEMFSLIQNYSGNTETRIVSLAASMGSVLALAGDKRSIENTALYFIHNAQGIGIGDYRDLASESEWLRDISTLIANLYAEYTSLTLDEALALMDDDSQFFGAALEALGFEVVMGSGEPNEATSRVNARMKFQEARAKMADEKYSDDIEKVAASIDYKKFGITNKVKPATQPPAAAGTQNQEASTMDLKSLLAANPDANTEYNAAITAAADTARAEGETAGKTAGREEMQGKITAVAPFLASADYPAVIGETALKVLKGEESEVTLKASVAAVDAVKEVAAQTAAAGETTATGETQGQHGSTTDVSEDGMVNNPEQVSAAAAQHKAEYGTDAGGTR